MVQGWCGSQGYGPLFDEGAYEQDGHIRIDFGTDTPFLIEDADLDRVGAEACGKNVRQLVDLTAAVEKSSGATARLLWSELGESLAQRLAARLGVKLVHDRTARFCSSRFTLAKLGWGTRVVGVS